MHFVQFQSSAMGLWEFWGSVHIFKLLFEGKNIHDIDFHFLYWILYDQIFESPAKKMQMIFFYKFPALWLKCHLYHQTIFLFALQSFHLNHCSNSLLLFLPILKSEDDSDILLINILPLVPCFLWAWEETAVSVSFGVGQI